jgi:hypothetical protein
MDVARGRVEGRQRVGLRDPCKDDENGQDRSSHRSGLSLRQGCLTDD